MVQKNKIKVILIGVGNLRNYGCEGIVQGTYAMFREFWPECELIIATANPVLDRKTFSGCENITFVPDKKRFTPYRIWKGILRRFFKIGKGSLVHINKELVKRKDIFLSCGGDNFCEVHNGTLYQILLDLMKAGENAKKNNVFYALWGASVGPFRKENEQIIYNNLQQADLLFVREKLAYEYVKSLGISDQNIRQIADPAFFMDSDVSFLINKNEDDILIGLNISPLAFHSTSFSIFEKLFSINDKIKLICIPHVMTSQGGSQDDYTFLQQFLDQSKYKEKIQLLPADLGAKKTKGAISKCDMLIASRMHACIAGVSVGIPTLFLTYSNKGKGMAQYVYNNQDWILSTEEIDESNLIEKVKLMLNQRNSIRNYLLENNLRFRNDASKAVVELKNKYLELDLK